MIPKDMITGNGDASNGESGGYALKQLTGQLVKFLSTLESTCDTCISLPDLDHIHYILSEGFTIDPKNDIPDIEEVRCGGCGKESNLKKCTKCGLVYYCSRPCQLKDWNNHKVICASSPNISMNTSMNASSNSLNGFGLLNGIPTFLRSPTISHTTTSVQSPNGGLEPISGPLPVAKEKTQETLEVAREALFRMNVTPTSPATSPPMTVTPTVKNTTLSPFMATSTPKVSTPVAAPVKPEHVEPMRAVKIGEKLGNSIVWQNEENASIYYMTDDDVLDQCASPLAAAATTPPIAPSVGLFCIAKSTDDGEFYRAQVKEINGSQVKVYFIDYGNYNVVEPKDLRELPSSINPKFGGPPPSAIPVSGKDKVVQAKMSACYLTPSVETFTVYQILNGVYILA